MNQGYWYDAFRPISSQPISSRWYILTSTKRNCGGNVITRSADVSWKKQSWRKRLCIDKRNDGCCLCGMLSDCKAMLAASRFLLLPPPTFWPPPSSTPSQCNVRGCVSMLLHGHLPWERVAPRDLVLWMLDEQASPGVKTGIAPCVKIRQ